MKSIVETYNSKRGMAAARFDDGYVIFEILEGWQPEKGDILEHDNFYEMGGQTFICSNRQRKVQVYVENVVANIQQAIRLIS